MLEVNLTNSGLNVNRHAFGAKRYFIPAGSTAGRQNTSEEPNQAEKQRAMRKISPPLCKCQGIRVWFPVTKVITDSFSGIFSNSETF